MSYSFDPYDGWTFFVYQHLTDAMDTWLWHNVDTDDWCMRAHLQKFLGFRNAEDAIAFKLRFIT